MTPTRGPSLTLRLTLLFALASAFVLFLLGLLIGNAVERHFEEQDLDVLNGKMQLARHILERDPGSQPKETLTQQLDDALTGHHGLIVAVYDQNGKTLYANESMVFPQELLSIGATPKREQPVKWNSNDDQPWRGISSMVKLGTNGGGSYTVAIATEITQATAAADYLWPAARSRPGNAARRPAERPERLDAELDGERRRARL